MSTRYVLAAACALFMAGTAAADTIAVPKDQPTIGEATLAAQDGDTIVISKGRYSESVVLDGKTNVTIRAKGKVIIDPAMLPGVSIRNCTGVAVQGIRVENASFGFLIDNCTDVELSKFSVSGAESFGVFALGSSNVNLSVGKIDDCGVDGVAYADEEPNFPVMGGTISKVKVSNCVEDGFDILGSNITVVKCTATDCGDDGFESDDDGPGPVRFEKCKASDVGDEGFELGSTATVCIKCKASDTGDDGFDIEADDCVLMKCTAKNATWAGFSIDGVDNADLDGCKAIKCRAQGFDLYIATNAKLDKCTAVKTVDDGFHLEARTRTCVLTKCKGTKSGAFDLNDESDGSSTFPGSKFKTTN